MSALLAFTTAILKLLDDAAATRYTTEQVTQGLRQALNEYSITRPLMRTTIIEATGESILELAADMQTMCITRLERLDDEGEKHELKFHAFTRDSSWFIELVEGALPAGECIELTYAALRSIDGLDGADGTSLPLEAETLLQMGGAGYCAMARAFSRAELVNLQPEVAAGLLELAASLLERFREGIRAEAGASFAIMPPIPTDRF